MTFVSEVSGYNWDQLRPFIYALHHNLFKVHFRLYKCIIMRYETAPKVSIKVIKHHLISHLPYIMDLASM